MSPVVVVTDENADEHFSIDNLPMLTDDGESYHR